MICYNKAAYVLCGMVFIRGLCDNEDYADPCNLVTLRSA